MKKAVLAFLLAVPALILLSGCSGGVNGEGNNTYSQTGGTTVIRANSFNDNAWVLIEKGQYESAISVFNQVLADNPTVQEAAEANNGIGWARSRLGSLIDGLPYFEKARSILNDAKVGAAGAYLQKASKADMEMVVNLLYVQLGGSTPHFHYVPTRNTGVSDAECHAMLGYAYAALGQNDDAGIQIEYAKELNPNWEGTTIEQASNMIDFLTK